MEETLPDGSLADSGAVWSSADGEAWHRETIGVRTDESLRSIFAAPGALIAAGDTFIGETANAMLWVSTDGHTWSRVPDQDAFAGINNDVRSLIGTVDGVLAVGSRWDDASGHPIPQAWLSEP